MEIDETSSLYLMLMYVYLRAYNDAVRDFEHAVKDVGYADMALMSVKQKYKERIDRMAKELSS